MYIFPLVFFFVLPGQCTGRAAGWDLTECGWLVLVCACFLRVG